MALVRILVDGYSLLHSWPQLAAGKARHSQAAREALVSILTSYQDAVGVPVTVFFDGSGKSMGSASGNKDSAVEVLFSKRGQTADQLIERAAHRFSPYGEVMAVTNDIAERDTVVSFGGIVSSCENFVMEVMNALNGVQEDVKSYNLKERNRFRRGPKT